MLLILRFGKEISHTYVFVKRSFPQQMIHTNRHWYWGRSTCWNKKFYFVLSSWIFDVSRRSTRVINAEERISCCCINFRYYWMSANNRDWIPLVSKWLLLVKNVQHTSNGHQNSRGQMFYCDAQWAVTKHTCHAWKMNQPHSKGGIAWNHFSRRETKAGKFGCKAAWNHAFSFIAIGGNSHFHPAGSL
jgi:hypothetical protein